MKPIEPTIQLGRMRIHKVHEMDSPVPLLSQLPGTTEADMRRLLEWYDQPDEVKEAACRAIRDGFNQYAVTWGIASLRQAIAAKPFYTPKGAIGMTASIGVATAAPSGEPGTLIAHAVQALYRAKSEGCNCVRRAPSVRRRWP